MKKGFLFFVCFLLALFVFGCTEPVDETLKIKDLEIEACQDLEVGDTFDLVLIYNKEIEVEFEWSSSDPEIVLVDNGKLTAKKEGTVTITVTEKNSQVKATVTVTVKEESIVDGPAITDEIKELFNTFVKGLPAETSTDLPLLEGYDVSYVFESNVAADGKVSREEDNLTVSGKVILTFKGETIESDYTVTLVGTFVDEISDRFIGQFKDGIDGKMEVVKKYDDYGGAYVRWESLNPEIFDNRGNLTRPLNDTYIEIAYTVKSKELEGEGSYVAKVLVHGESLSYKNALVEEWIKKSYPENMVLYPGDILPNYCEDYEATITWLDANEQTPDFVKLAQDPVLGEAVVLTVRVTYPNSEDYLDFVMDYRVWNKKYTDDFEKIDDLINAIGGKDIRSYAYKSRGYDYENMGYVYFFENKPANINRDYLLEYTYGRVRTGIVKKSTEYVVIHDTAGGLPTHTAESFALNQVQANNNPTNTYISWHFTVGTDGIYQSLPTDEVAYHAGDGSHVYGDIWASGGYDDRIGGGNRNGIGIETCINNGTDYNDTLRILAKLVAELLIENKLSVDRIKQHWHFSGKDCPAVIRHCNRWEEFRDLVKIEYFVKTELPELELSWESLTPSLLNNDGKVLSFDGNFEVSYKATAKLNGNKKEYTFKANVIHEEEVYVSL